MYVRFLSDRERKLLLFTGKFDKKEVPETDFQTGEVVPGKYKTRYSFECYDITTTTKEEFQTSQPPQPSIWERGPCNTILPIQRQKHFRSYSQWSARVNFYNIPNQSTTRLIIL